MDKKDLILECTKEIEESIDFEFLRLCLIQFDVIL